MSCYPWGWMQYGSGNEDLTMTIERAICIGILAVIFVWLASRLI